MSEPIIYLDHHATTPVDPRVLERMMPFFTENFGNPASVTHWHGRRASTAVEEARSVIADVLRVRSSEVFFTSGATEANNTALRLARRGHLIISAIEHKSILAPAERLRDEGVEVTILQPDRDGFISPDDLRATLREETSLVSIMAANGDIGTIQPVGELAAICRERGVLFHTDATQAVGKIPVDLSEIGCDLLSLSAHKLYGPKGIGALVIRRGIRLDPLLVGGGQERTIRSGTVNVPGVVGLAAALELCRVEMGQEAVRLTRLRNRLWDQIVAVIPGTFVNGPRELRLPGNLNAGFDQIEAETLISAMHRFSLSSGSACSSGDREPSHVLRAIGLDDTRALGSIRFGLGRGTTAEGIDLLVRDLEAEVSHLRGIAVR